MTELQGPPTAAPSGLPHAGLLRSKLCRGRGSGADPRDGAMISAAGLWTPQTMTPQQGGGGGGFRRPRDARRTNTQGAAVVTGADCDPGWGRGTASDSCSAGEEEDEESRKHQNCPQQGPSCTKGTSSAPCPSSQYCLWPGRAQRDLPETWTALPASPSAHRPLEEELSSLFSCWDRLAKTTHIWYQQAEKPKPELKTLVGLAYIIHGVFSSL